jgi:hypothetical protein
MIGLFFQIFITMMFTKFRLNITKDIIKKNPICKSFNFFFHQVISYYSRRGGVGGVSIITEKSDFSLNSQLLIRDANPDDQGTYTCSLSNANVEAKTRVFVLKGKKSVISS